MHKRQVKNQKTMELFLRELEKNVQKSHEEREHVTDMMRELEAAKNRVLVEIQAKRVEFLRAVKERKKALVNREMEAINASKMQKWRENRGKLQKEIEAEVRRLYYEVNM